MEEPTIKISEKLKEKLKMFCASTNTTYDETSEEACRIFEEEFPFKTENEFRLWFKDNFKIFGYKRIIIDLQTGTPDFVMENETGKAEKVELEYFDFNFLSHNHPLEKVDRIIAVFGNEETIKGIPVFYFKNMPRGKRINIYLSSDLHTKLKIKSIQKNTTMRQLIIDIFNKEINIDEDFLDK